MNSNIQKLSAIAQKPARVILGLMSGTSLDGLDIVLCSVEGSGNTTKLKLLQFETIPYSDDFKKEIRSVFSKKQIDLEKLCLLNPWVALQHAEMINTALKKWGVAGTEVDLLASHGQTIYHAPQHLHRQSKFGNATLQIGDGDHLAVATGIITLSDFRQKNIAAGGEGAPLAVYGDHILFSQKGADRLLLNIGGIANFTFLPGSSNEALICTDTGPGNTMMDAFIQQHYPGRFYDEHAAVARSGNVNPQLLRALKEHPFFEQAFPKTTGPELFNLYYLQHAIQQSNTGYLDTADIMATLNRFTADSIANAIKACVKNKNEITILGSGGGIHNPLLMETLQQQLPGYHFMDTSSMGIEPDAKEAILFALLANEAVCGDPCNNIPGIPKISMGKISFPY